jgi:hypothetical protein
MCRWGAIHAGIAPAFTFMLDQLAYNKTDLRATTADALADERAAQVYSRARKSPAVRT